MGTHITPDASLPDASSVNSPQTILVVGDDPAVRGLLAYLMEEAGYNALTASNGAEGIRLAREASPALIVMDIMLPEVNGIEAIRQLQEDGATRHIPIIACSAGYNLRREAEQLAVAAVVAKPFDIDTIVAEVAECLKRTTPPA